MLLDTGTLAGHNSVRHALGKELLQIPRACLSTVDIIAYVKERVSIP